MADKVVTTKTSPDNNSLYCLRLYDLVLVVIRINAETTTGTPNALVNDSSNRTRKDERNERW